MFNTSLADVECLLFVGSHAHLASHSVLYLEHQLTPPHYVLFPITAVAPPPHTPGPAQTEATSQPQPSMYLWEAARKWVMYSVCMCVYISGPCRVWVCLCLHTLSLFSAVNPPPPASPAPSAHTGATQTPPVCSPLSEDTSCEWHRVGQRACVWGVCVSVLYYEY